MARAKKMKMDAHTTLDLSLAIMLGGFLGARFLHVIYEAPAHYREDLFNVFRIWQGGFVFYGGVIGAFIGTELVIRRQRLQRGLWQDLFTPLFPLGYAVGRLACLFAGCCYGLPTDLPWAIHFPEGVEAPPGLSLHPTQAYAMIWEMALFIAILYLGKNKKPFCSQPGTKFYIWLVGHGFGRLFMEHFRADDRGKYIMGFSISSVISYGLIAWAGSVLISRYKKLRIKNAP